MTNYMELVQPWDEDDRYEGQPHVPGDLRMLVFLEGVLIDSVERPVQGSGYECAALEMQAARRPREIAEPEPVPPPWQRELSALDLQVGGRKALLELSAGPLESRALPATCAEVAGQLDALDLGEEFTVAVRNALVHVAETDPDLLLVPGRPEQVAAAAAWIVARANGMTGARGRLRQADLARAFAIKPFPSHIAGQMTSAFQRYLPRERSSWGYSCLRDELGRPDVLLTGVRARIVRERDRALAAAESARRDEEAREA